VRIFFRRAKGRVGGSVGYHERIVGKAVVAGTHMTKVGKTLIGVLVAVDLAFVFYIMSPQIEHSGSKSDDSAEAAAKGAELEAGVIANASNGAQVASGSIAGSASGSGMPDSTSDAGRVVAAPPPSPSTSDGGRVAMAPAPRPVAVPNVMLERKSGSAALAAMAPSASVPAASGNANEQRVAVRQQPVKTVDVTNVRRPADAKPNVASRSERSADEARSSASNPGTNSGAGSGAGSNAVAAAMTEALVRQSAMLDPNLPPPDMSKSVSMRDAPETSSRAGANPVAAAMTEQLVRESTKFNPPAQHAPAQPGAQ
jgi:hypothetical protein